MALNTAATSPFNYPPTGPTETPPLQVSRADLKDEKTRPDMDRLAFSSTWSTATYCAPDLSPSPPEYRRTWVTKSYFSSSDGSSRIASFFTGGSCES